MLFPNAKRMGIVMMKVEAVRTKLISQTEIYSVSWRSLIRACMVTYNMLATCARKKTITTPRFDVEAVLVSGYTGYAGVSK